MSPSIQTLELKTHTQMRHVKSWHPRSLLMKQKHVKSAIFLPLSGDALRLKGFELHKNAQFLSLSDFVV
jgi:hypothetical protein